MKTLRDLATLILSILGTFSAFAQQGAIGSHSGTLPTRIVECEGGPCGKIGASGSAIWTFSGLQGKGEFTTGVQPLTIENFDQNAIVIRRVDTVGPVAGILVSVYTGKIQGNQVSGTVVYHDSRNPQPSNGVWFGTVEFTGSPVLQPALVPATQASPAPAPHAPPAQAPQAPFAIEKIVDIVTPERPFHPSIAAAPAWKPYPNPVAGVNLTGFWERNGDSSEKIAIVQLRDSLTVVIVEGRRSFISGAILMTGQFTSAASVSGKVAYDDHGDERIKYQDGTLTITGPENIKISSSYGSGGEYHLTSHVAFEDVPCDPRNPEHISGDSAYRRGEIYMRNKDQVTANCWFYVGAMQGGSDAQAAYADALIHGDEINVDVDQAMVWLQRSVMHGNASTSWLLQSLFAQGVGVPASNQRHTYWLARWQGTTPYAVHTASENVTRRWMTQAESPCDLSAPPNAQPGEALAMGRVAYQARALQAAHCWFRISAQQGNAKALVYLGLQSAFGMGVKQNSQNGFAYMSRAAAMGDPFGRVYLANFYRYGIGTAPDEGAAGAIIAVVIRNADGQDAFMRVQGTLLNQDESLAAFMKIAVAAGGEQACLDKAVIDHRLHPNHTQPNCSPSPSDVLTSRQMNAQHTIETPEELYPEKPFWAE